MNARNEVESEDPDFVELFPIPGDALETAIERLNKALGMNRDFMVDSCRRKLQTGTSSTDAEDIVQDCVVKLLGRWKKKLPDFEGPAVFKAFISKVLRHRLIDTLRRDRSRKRNELQRSELSIGPRLALPGHPTADPASTIEWILELAEASKLEATDRKVIQRRFVDNVPMKAIAAETGEGIATAYRRLHRILKILRQAAEQE